MKDALDQNPNNPDIPLPQKILGKNLFHAPQPALTSASGGSLSSAGPANLTTGDSTILTNAITRIANIEAALIKLGLLKHP